MKKKFAAVVAACAALALSACVLAGCSGGSADQEDFTLIVGFDNQYPPYGYMDDNGDPAGFDIDLAREVAERNGWGFEAKPIAWDSKDAELGNGNINCIWNGFTYEGREADYARSTPYILNSQVVVAKADSGIASLEDLSGKVVITQADSAALHLLEGDQAALAATFAELRQISDYNNAYMQLESGQVDAVVCDASVAQTQMAAKPDAYVLLDETLQTEHYAVGFALDNQDVADQVSATLLEMYNDGTIEELIATKYNEGTLKLDYANWCLTE